MKQTSTIFLFLAFFADFANGQSFIFNQFFQPSVRLNVEYTPDLGIQLLQNNPDKLSYGRANLNFIIPVKSKLGLKVDWGELLKTIKRPRGFKWNRIEDIAQVKLFQLFWNIRPQVFYQDFQPQHQDSLHTNPLMPKQVAFGLSTGLTGIHLLKRLRMLFYSANVGFLEDQRSIHKLHPNFTGVLGVANINRLTYYWYYGVYISYNNGRILPAPFFGIEVKLKKRVWLNITLPVQMRLGFQFSKKTRLDLVAGLTGFSSGFGFQQNNVIARSFYSGFQLRVSTMFNIRLGKQTKLYLEAGVLPYRQFYIGKRNEGYFHPTLAPTFYGGFSIFYSFQKSLLGSMMDGLIQF